MNRSQAFGEIARSIIDADLYMTLGPSTLPTFHSSILYIDDKHYPR
jgi:hypothetical protein